MSAYGYGHGAYGSYPYGHSEVPMNEIVTTEIGVREEGERALLKARHRGIPKSKVRTPIKTSVKMAQ